MHNLARLSANQNWFISRNAKSDFTPEYVKTNLLIVLPKLLDGHIWLAGVPRSLNDRGYYGSADGGNTKGIYSYNMVMTLTPEVRTQVKGIQIYYLNANEKSNEGIVSLNDINEANQYERIIIPSDQIEKLLPYSVIHVGLTHSNESLQEIYFGENARRIIDDLVRRQDPETHTPFFKK